MENDSLRVQLAELNQRARHHMSTLWQMPMAYLAVVMVALGNLQVKDQCLVGSGLAVAGLISLFGMSGSLEGAHRAVEGISETEKALGLPLTARKRPWLHAMPYFALVVVGLVVSLVAALTAS